MLATMSTPRIPASTVDPFSEFPSCSSRFAFSSVCSEEPLTPTNGLYHIVKSAEDTIRSLQQIRSEVVALKFPGLTPGMKARADRNSRLLALAASRALRRLHGESAARGPSPSSRIASSTTSKTIHTPVKPTKSPTGNYHATFILERLRPKATENLLRGLCPAREKLDMVRSLIPLMSGKKKCLISRRHRIRSKRPLFSTQDGVQLALGLYGAETTTPLKLDRRRSGELSGKKSFDRTKGRRRGTLGKPRNLLALMRSSEDITSEYKLC